MGDGETIRESDGSGLDQGVSSGVGEKWAGPVDSLQLKFVGFSDEVDIRN